MLRPLVLATLLALLACTAAPEPRPPRGAPMSIEATPIIVEQTCAASPEQVWLALTDPSQMSQWFFEPIAEFEPQVGFETRFVVEVEDLEYVHHWRVTDVIPGRAIAYQWRYDGIAGDSQVLWELTSTSPLGTTVRLTHRGHATFPRDTPVFSRAAGVSGWTFFLDQLAKHFEGETPTARAHHSIDYVEIDVTDLEAAKAFYARAFGWSFNDYGPTYAGIKKDGGEAGGLRLVDTVQPGGPLVIVYSTTLEDSLASVRAAGGTINKEIFTFPGGRRFEFTDPSGNALAVWSDE